MSGGVDMSPKKSSCSTGWMSKRNRNIVYLFSYYKSEVFYLMLRCEHKRAEILTWAVFTSPSILSKASPPFWKQHRKGSRREGTIWKKNKRFQVPYLNYSFAIFTLWTEADCWCFFFFFFMWHVSFHIISAECVKMWFIERTQRQCCHSGGTYSAYPVNPPRWPRQNAFSFRKKKKFPQPNFWKKKKNSQMPLKQLPSVSLVPLSSSCWRWPGTDLLDRSPGALPVWGRQSINQPIYRSNFIYMAHFKQIRCKVLYERLTKSQDAKNGFRD